MGAILSYSLTSAIILACLYLAYKIAIAGERQFALSRMAIHLIYAISIASPAALAFWHSCLSSGTGDLTTATITALPLQVMSVKNAVEAAPVWPKYAIWIYIVGASIAFFRYVMANLRLSAIIKGCRKIRLESGYALYITQSDDMPPFSWMKYIVMSEKEYGRDHEAILTHELKHLESRHWLDLTIGHLVAVFQWYNPAAWLLIEELKTVHEYQADEAVIQSGVDIKQYQYLLIEKAVGERLPSPANSLNHSKLKKRVTMMYKTKPSPWRRLAALAIVPALAAGVGIVSVPAVASVLTQTEKATLVSAHKVSENSGMEKIVAAKSSAKEAPKQSANNARVDRPVVDSVCTVKGDVKIVTPSSDDETIWMVNGEVVTKSQVESLNPEMIEVITVNKESVPTVYVELKDDVTLKQALAPRSNRLDEVKVVGYGSAKKKEFATEADAVKLAEYPGGMEAMMKYLSLGLRYPEKAKEAGKEGVVVVAFTVTSHGNIEAPAIITGVSEDLNEEALRMVREMPDWTPAQNASGEPVASEYSLPITFKLK